MDRPARAFRTGFVLVPLVLLGLLGILLADLVLRREPLAGAADSVLGRAGSTAGFTISGDLAGLAPGREVPLQLVLGNPHGRALLVDDIEVTVAPAGPDCPGDVLEVGRLTGPVAVAGGGSAEVVLPVRMLLEAGDACSGGTFQLSYAGSGRLR